VSSIEMSGTAEVSTAHSRGSKARTVEPASATKMSGAKVRAAATKMSSAKVRASPKMASATTTTGKGKLTLNGI
jgi:hypothetical protein